MRGNFFFIEQKTLVAGIPPDDDRGILLALEPHSLAAVGLIPVPGDIIIFAFITVYPFLHPAPTLTLLSISSNPKVLKNILNGS